jgi:hypothetical protein
MVSYIPLTTQALEHGALVGPWIVQDRVGSGSHGVVYRVIHSGRPHDGSYALKLAHVPEDTRFEREARLLSSLCHPAVPRYEHSGWWTAPNGSIYPFIVMQWAEGVTLYEWGAVHGLTLRQAMLQLSQVARALEATHRHGVHRDVKGDNVRVSPQGQAMLLDYGCCWYPHARPLTGSSIPPGTEPYRSPRLLRFRYESLHKPGATYEFQPADDVYALGVTAYRLLAGTYPPPLTDPECKDEPGRPRPPPLLPPKGLAERCPELSALILRMLSDEPQARGSAGELAEALERLAQQAGPLVDLPWVARSVLPPPAQATRLDSPGWERLKALAPLFLAVAAFSMLVLLTPLIQRTGEERQVAYEQPPRVPKARGSPDAGTGAVGEEAMASAAPYEEALVSEWGVARDVPKRPLDGQKRPPCKQRGAVEINGGCWWDVVDAEPPPCETDKYEYGGRCYAPIFTSQRRPTSEEP